MTREFKKAIVEKDSEEEIRVRRVKPSSVAGLYLPQSQ